MEAIDGDKLRAVVDVESADDFEVLAELLSLPNSAVTLNLSAPTSGTYSGILFFGNRNVSGVTNTFNGTASSVMTGA